MNFSWLDATSVFIAIVSFIIAATTIFFALMWRVQDKLEKKVKNEIAELSMKFENNRNEINRITYESINEHELIGYQLKRTVEILIDILDDCIKDETQKAKIRKKLLNRIDNITFTIRYNELLSQSNDKQKKALDYFLNYANKMPERICRLIERLLNSQYNHFKGVYEQAINLLSRCK